MKGVPFENFIMEGEDESKSNDFHSVDCCSGNLADWLGFSFGRLAIAHSAFFLSSVASEIVKKAHHFPTARRSCIVKLANQKVPLFAVPRIDRRNLPWVDLAGGFAKTVAHGIQTLLAVPPAAGNRNSLDKFENLWLLVMHSL